MRKDRISAVFFCIISYKLSRYAQEDKIPSLQFRRSGNLLAYYIQIDVAVLLLIHPSFSKQHALVLAEISESDHPRIETVKDQDAVIGIVNYVAAGHLE